MRNKLIFAAALSIGLFFLFRSNFAKAAVDNTLISIGVENTENVSMSNKTIAERNNNPTNIRESSDNWEGLANPRAKQGFFNFTSPVYAFRATAKIILGAYAKRGAVTLGQVISVWAPPSDGNKTDDYIQFVSKKSGVSITEKITKSNIAKIIYAMAIIESGKAWSMADVEKGVSLV